MAIPPLTDLYIDETYPRLVQTNDTRTEFADGLGNQITFGTTNTGSLLLTASVVSNIITFTKGDGSTFPITVNTGSGGGSTNTGSLLLTASAVDNTITFIKGDGSTFPVTVSQTFVQSSSDIILTVLNQSGAQINKGIVVRITGSNNSSDIPRIGVADWTNDNLSANTLGLVQANIPNGETGSVLTQGLFKGYNTNTPGWTTGQVVYLGPNGSITGSAPAAPLHGVRLGQVVRNQSNNGSIYVSIDNGYELGELHDVIDNTTNTSFGDLLVRSGSVWINSKNLTGSYTLTGSLNITGSLSGDSLTLRGNLIVSGNTTIGDATTDTIRMNAATMSLGSGNGILNIDSNTLYVDGANNRVGIGTSSPSERLEVSTGNMYLNFGGAGYDKYLRLNEGGSPGNTSTFIQPSYGNTFILNNARLRTDSKYYYEPSDFNNRAASKITLEPTVGQIVFDTAPPGNQNTEVTWKTGLLVTDGKVGVGGIFPSYNLHVTGSVAFPDLTNVSQTNVVSIDTATGQLYYQSATGANIVNAKVNISSNGNILTFDPTLYYSCFIEYHAFLYDAGAPAVVATRAGNIKISVPYTYASYDGQYNIPFVETTTECRTHPDYVTDTTEDIYFKANYDSGTGLIQLVMYNNNASYNAQINSQYKLIGYVITP